MTAGDDQLRWESGQAVFRMPAEIDVTNANHLRAALRAAVRQATSVLIIDMSATTFCDSAGVQAIVDAYNQVEARNQNAVAPTQLRLVATVVRRIITLVGIDQLIPVYPTLEAALADSG
ncbi:MAG TPA: STAS domain-containing protein [Streptosporangiaceae bacterium]|nr:STAS domain-containing protein [Streptosporangiaceae bacterium]